MEAKGPLTCRLITRIYQSTRGHTAEDSHLEGPQCFEQRTVTVSPSGCVPPRLIMTTDKSKYKRYSFQAAQLRTSVKSCCYTHEIGCNLFPHIKAFGTWRHITIINQQPLTTCHWNVRFLLQRKVLQSGNKTEINCLIHWRLRLTQLCTFSPYRAVNTYRLGYKNQSVNIV
jgi:hypothetical protein